jgi:hypothetical protein
MFKDELRADRMTKWIAVLPEDIRDAIEETVDPRFDEPARVLEQEIKAALASDADVVPVLRRHDDVIAAMGRPRRLQLLAIIVDESTIFSPAVVIRRILTAQDEEGGEATSSVRFPGLFKNDYDDYARPITSRMVQGSASIDVVESIMTGMKDMDIFATGHGGL